jgi:hypothetical protein
MVAGLYLRSLPSYPTRKLVVVARDPALKNDKGDIITEQIEIPNERLNSGPKGYRVHVIDFDASAGTFYRPLSAARYDPVDKPPDPYQKKLTRSRILTDPGFHAQHVYAIVMESREGTPVAGTGSSGIFPTKFGSSVCHISSCDASR